MIFLSHFHSLLCGKVHQNYIQTTINAQVHTQLTHTYKMSNESKSSSIASKGLVMESIKLIRLLLMLPLLLVLRKQTCYFNQNDTNVRNASSIKRLNYNNTL